MAMPSSSRLEFDAALFQQPPHAIEAAVFDAPPLGKLVLRIGELGDAPGAQFRLYPSPCVGREPGLLAGWASAVEECGQPTSAIRGPPGLELGAAIPKDRGTRRQAWDAAGLEQAQPLHAHLRGLPTQRLF